ncbi:MAG: PIG-L family deacetylase [Lachnoclostridium sp.]|nr:PIG-L family deacetylase [Lachnospira sp.]MCM1247486.1 PIG-L family deacetylase [Lachnoclostridium sp.]
MLPAMSVSAEELNARIVFSGGGDSKSLQDGSYSTARSFGKGDTVTVSSKDGSSISGIYMIWDSPVKPWTLTTDNGDISCGEHGFLHEYISLESPTASAVITVPEDGMRISDIRIFGEGGLPEDVQIWNPPVEKADIMLVAAHADDEILFLGGIIPTYAVVRGAQLQVVYMSEFWSTTGIREHEKLDGLWAAGLTNYPVCGNFKDVYSDNIETAKKQYSLDDMTEYLAGEIRRCKPLVIVTHDENGEYGHGFHMLTSKAVTDAVEAAADKTAYEESAVAYGVWDTPKTYLHLYGENKIRLNLREPIGAMGGRTALEIAADAYKQHVSQQWCWFYVSDDYKYSCADFGLYRTRVGEDSGNDLLENLKTYRVQEEEAQAAVLASQKLIEEKTGHIREHFLSLRENAAAGGGLLGLGKNAFGAGASRQGSELENIGTGGAVAVVIVICAAIVGISFIMARKLVKGFK